MDDRRCIVNVAGERLVLLPSRAIWWESASTLFVADIHLGRLASMRARGAAVPDGALDETLRRLGKTLRRTDATRLVILGDLIEHRDGLTRSTVERVAASMQDWPTDETLLVPGNHDLNIDRLPSNWPIEVIPSGERFGPFCVSHAPGESGDDTGFELAGHYHPTARLEAAGDRIVRPCFAFGDAAAVLPAFHLVTNGVEMDPARSKLFVVLQREVVALRSAGSNEHDITEATMEDDDERRDGR